MHKDGQDEVGGRQPVLTNALAEGGTAAVAAGPGGKVLFDAGEGWGGGGGCDRMGVVAWSVGYCEKGREAACCLELAGGVGQ